MFCGWQAGREKQCAGREKLRGIPCAQYKRNSQFCKPLVLRCDTGTVKPAHCHHGLSACSLDESMQLFLETKNLVLPTCRVPCLSAGRELLQTSLNVLTVETGARATVSVASFRWCLLVCTCFLCPLIPDASS